MTEYLKYQTDLSTLASVFDELTFWSARFGAMLFQHLRLSRGIDILDLGCATGFPLFELANVHGESCRVFGIDPWGDALIHAATKRDGYGIHNVTLIQGDGLQLPFVASQFDLIVSN
ncbi:MAG: class I SAM-dependent methyltransferase, partial [Chitinophagaceae bacterium]|nr:class I SAM-dependent methyltransferase [Anaerolineae bacterium]